MPTERANKITSTGHADIIQTPEGDWWAVFLGVRPYEGEYVFNTGRETFLLPVAWENGFPIINRKETAISTLVNKKICNPLPISINAATKPLKLRVEAKAGKADFSYSIDGKKWISLVQNADITNLSTEKGGGFQGATIGMYATTDHLNKIVIGKPTKKK